MRHIAGCLLLFISIFLAQTPEKLGGGGDRTPLHPYAFIRVKNERVTLLASLNSILPAIDRGVIAYNDTDDGSEEIILKFCKKHPGFKPFKYPYHVEPSHSRAYLSGVPKESRLDTYYNAVLEQIPEDAWMIKIDVDEIFDSTMLKESFKIIRYVYDAVSYPRLNLHVENGKVFVANFKNFEGIVDPSDQLLINKHRLSHFMHISKKPFVAYEVQSFPRKIMHRAKLMIYHFMYLKSWRSKEDAEEIDGKIDLIPLEEFKKRLPVEGIEIPPGFLDEEKILKIYNSFDLEHLKRIKRKK